MPSATEQQMLDEIKAIRQRMGGGVAERLKGLNLDDETNASNREEFDQELLRLNKQALVANPPVANPPKQHDGKGDNRLGDDARTNSGQQFGPSRSSVNSRPVSQSTYNEREQLQQEIAHRNQLIQYEMRARQGALEFQNRAINHGPVNSKPSPDAQLAQRQRAQLRDAARRMEELAAEFEESDLYEEADETRDRARRFWEKARHFKR